MYGEAIAGAAASTAERSAMSPAQRACVVENLPRMHDIVRRMAWALPRHVDREELVQAGALGLIAAARRFDPRFHCSFATYSEIRIRGAVIDQLRTLGWAPRSVRIRTRALERAEHAVEQRTGRRAEGEELAAVLGLSLEALAALRRRLDDAPIRRAYDVDEDEIDSLLDRQRSELQHPLDQLARERTGEAVAEAIARLPERERALVSLVYWNELSLEQAGRTIGVSESRARVLHDRALLKLRGTLRRLIG
jgi:RNA polymerase sigma factor for flagellar operon FliA